jgi:hypothetical protein
VAGSYERKGSEKIFAFFLASAKIGNQNKKIATVLAFGGDFTFQISILNGLR